MSSLIYRIILLIIGGEDLVTSRSEYDTQRQNSVPINSILAVCLLTAGTQYSERLVLGQVNRCYNLDTLPVTMNS